MANSSQDPSVRRILPQNAHQQQASQMSSFAFAPQQYAQRETQKNFVFVDEHNRHKRLKVMRACEGCRRRKIKCDAATTNTWPCSACIRLKLHCVRPNGYEGAPDSMYDPPLDQSDQFSHIQMQPSHLPNPSTKSTGPLFNTQDAFPNDAYSADYTTLPFDPSQANLHYAATNPQISLDDSNPYGPHDFPTPPSFSGIQHGDSSPGAQSPDPTSHADLADLLGTLKMDRTGTAPYLRNKASFRREETPAVEDDDDFESALPSIPMTPGRGLKIRIPPLLMPDEDTTMQYFDLYFNHVHPYVPVLNRTTFYRQWSSSPETISPLILEAIFAVGGRLAEDASEGQQWLALASRHADYFMDVPRLSTLQALLILLKAREAAPKRGYYYRSWMTIVHCVQMGKDLGLDEHVEDHKAGRSCEFTPSECQLRNRIWKTIFVCEVMVGAPQGRHDLAVDLDTIDFDPPKPTTGMEDGEFQITRNFTYFSRVVRNVRKLVMTYSKLRKKKDWGTDPDFQKLIEDFGGWLKDLPADLSVDFPTDGSPPWLPTAFLGNMHSYHYLSLILFHRPILTFLDPNSPDGTWKQHMMICYNAARALCRLQEAVIDTFGLTGLQCMQRGYSFSVYAGLSCIVIHLVAIVSPDPELNSDAREYFTRHMRILEQVMEVWPMQELQKQVDAVREAFSANTKRPFLLKPSFPYGSPHPSTSSNSPAHIPGYRPSVENAGLMKHNFGAQSHTAPSLGMMPSGNQGPGLQQNHLQPPEPSWNPARIFEQWNTSFGPSIQASAGSESPSSMRLTPPAATQLGHMGGEMQSMPAQVAAPPVTAPPPIPQFMTPAMWQESVASVYEGGLKRAWDYDSQHTM